MSEMKNRAVRIPDDLWEASLAAASSRGETVSDVVRKALARYVARVTSVSRQDES